jgi:AcrR family transcriptional regulator
MTRLKAPEAKKSDAGSTRAAGSRGRSEEEILRVSARLFRTQGFYTTTTRQVAAELGLHKASLYHYIDGKEDILYRLCLNSLIKMQEAVADAIERNIDPKERLREVIVAHVESMLADRDMHATMLFELRSLSEPRLSSVLESRDRYEKTVFEVISEAQESAFVRSDIPAHQLTLALLNILNWTIFWYVPEGELSPRDLAVVLASVYLDGVLDGRSGQAALDAQE